MIRVAAVNSLSVHPVIAGIVWLWLAITLPAEELRYQRAPENIRAVLNAPATPVVSLSPKRDRMIIVQGVRYPPLGDLAEPYLGLAGVRINPANDGPFRAPRYLSLKLKAVPDGPEQPIAVPPGARLGFPSWSPDGAHLAFARFTPEAIELWVVDTKTAAARRIRNVELNAGFASPFEWMPDSQTLLCRVIPDKRPPKPPQRATPTGPAVVESTGQKALVRTYQDLLNDPRDEALYEHHATVQLALVNTRSGRVTNLGAPGIFQSVEMSPDGNHFLLERVKKPFSYLVPASGFPKSVEVWDRTGRVELKLTDVPLQTERPPGGVTPGPRRYHWRPTTPATLVWVEALDDGDPNRRVAARDRLLMLRAPFESEPMEVFRTQSRFSALSWAEVGYVALIRDYSSSKRWYRTYLFNPDNPLEEPVLLWNRSAQDRYGDPGTPLVRTLSTGQRAMRVHDNCLFLSGTGATPAGERPFLDRFNLTTLETTRIFECDPGHYETVVGFVQADGSQFITRRESPTESPNYMLREPRTGLRQALTKFPDPAPQLRQVTKQLVTYERDDGVPLSGTLYLPPGYQPGTRLPTLIWAYPREYNDADTAGQVSGSTNRFTLIGGSSQLFFALQGYAVLDGAAMPVVGDPKKANDTYVEQIVANARAAVDALVERGVTDPDRVGVAGHSYGAFMTANLLAHSDLFRAGIARSGAYNRTLTPFGFQNESRTLWQAPDMYLKNSAFMAANKINEPLLLIHGEADENSGTFPMQSERLFQAVQGNGGLARFVLLPHETHSYEARESIEHVLWEMLNWFDRHVKNATPTNDASGR